MDIVLVSFILLSFITFSILALYVWETNKLHEQNTLLIQALKAKDLNELTSNRRLENEDTKAEIPQREYIPFNELGDTEFDNMIEKQLKSE